MISLSGTRRVPVFCIMTAAMFLYAYIECCVPLLDRTRIALHEYICMFSAKKHIMEVITIGRVRSGCIIYILFR